MSRGYLDARVARARARDVTVRRGAARRASAESVKDGNKLWPFCSERCHLVDLGRWFGEEYRVPADEAGPTKPEDSSE